MKVVNLTRGDINVIHPDDPSKKITFPQSSRGYATVKIEDVEIGDVHGFPVTEVEYGGVRNLPPEREDTLYIVNRQVRNALPDREDLICPGRSIRYKGEVVGCLGFSR
jgi:hypothetical protein